MTINACTEVVIFLGVQYVHMFGEVVCGLDR